MEEAAKEKEIEYYDKRIAKWLRSGKLQNYSGGFNLFILDSYLFWRKKIEENCQGKKILDYGCGTGVHSFFPVKKGAKKVIGIDLSENSLEIARHNTQKEVPGGKAEFLKMDCEETNFPNNSFDIVMDSGTLYSLDKEKTILEISRLLKNDGMLIAIETLGHNPFTNLKRKINQLFGKRTELALRSVLKTENLENFKKYFKVTEVHFFHIISWLAFPFLNLPGGKILLKLLEEIDGFLGFFPFFRKYAFKVVFIFSFPKK